MGSYIDKFEGGQEKKSGVIVTIDGPSGSGKGTLGGHIAEFLGIEHFSASDVFYQIAEERGLSETELSEKAGKEVDIAIDKKTLERGLKQSCVIDGRITSWVLGDHSDLKIFLTAELKERASRIADRDEVSEPESWVEKRDSEDQRRYREYYGIDSQRYESDPEYDWYIRAAEPSLAALQALDVVARVLRSGATLVNCWYEGEVDRMMALLWVAWNEAIPQERRESVGIKQSEYRTFLSDRGGGCWMKGFTVIKLTSRCESMLTACDGGCGHGCGG
jgi:cytidylate kinase